MADRAPAPRYAVLNAHSHQRLKVLGHQGYGFARRLRSADLVLSEFEPAASLYPLVFVRDTGGRYRPVALLAHAGSADGCVGADGRWTRAQCADVCADVCADGAALPPVCAGGAGRSIRAKRLRRHDQRLALVRTGRAAVRPRRQTV